MVRYLRISCKFFSRLQTISALFSRRSCFSVLSLRKCILKLTGRWWSHFIYVHIIPFIKIEQRRALNPILSQGIFLALVNHHGTIRYFWHRIRIHHRKIHMDVIVSFDGLLYSCVIRWLVLLLARRKSWVRIPEEATFS